MGRGGEKVGWGGGGERGIGGVTGGSEYSSGGSCSGRTGETNGIGLGGSSSGGEFIGVGNGDGSSGGDTSGVGRGDDSSGDETTGGGGHGGTGGRRGGGWRARSSNAGALYVRFCIEDIDGEGRPMPSRV